MRSARFFLVVLLDARVLVIDVERGRHVAGEDAGAPARRRAPRDLAIEDQLHLLGAAEVEVLADHLLEEQAAMDGLIEHLGQ